MIKSVADRTAEQRAASHAASARPKRLARLQNDEPRPLVQLRDLAQMATHAASAVGLRILPERRWPSLARRIAAASSSLFRGRRRQILAKIRGFFPGGIPTGESAEALEARIGERLAEETFLLRQLARHPDWRPDIGMVGAEQVEHALEEGGAMLWVAAQPSAMLLTAVVCHDRGWPIYRLSHWVHGLSHTHFGIAFGNDAIQRIENQYATRIVIGPEGAGPAMARCVEVMSEGALVQVHAVANARRLTEYALQGGRATLALGAPKLAMDAGLPIFSVTVGRTGGHDYQLHFAQILERGERLPLEKIGQRLVDEWNASMQRDPAHWGVHSRQTFLEPGDAASAGDYA